jgi:hypothetical protein
VLRKLAARSKGLPLPSSLSDMMGATFDVPQVAQWPDVPFGRPPDRRIAARRTAAVWGRRHGATDCRLTVVPLLVSVARRVFWCPPCPVAISDSAVSSGHQGTRASRHSALNTSCSAGICSRRGTGAGGSPCLALILSTASARGGQCRGGGGPGEKRAKSWRPEEANPAGAPKRARLRAMGQRGRKKATA